MKLFFPPLILLLVALSTLQWTGCTAETESKSKSTTSAPASTRFPIKIGSKVVHLELALNNTERQKGLMFREALDKDHGMLFLFEQASAHGFWMRNTPLPLDIGYFDASGRLLEIYKLYPYDENAVKSRSQEILIAVEMEQGWFQENDMTPGAMIDMDALIQAVSRRGYFPERYSLK